MDLGVGGGLERSGGRAVAPSRTRVGRPAVLAVAIVGAWLLTVVGQATGNAVLAHDHALALGAPALPGALPVFLAAWSLMIVAMMLPASLPALRAVAQAAGAGPADRTVASFLGGYGTVWLVFGLAALVGDVVLQRVAQGMTGPAARPWPIDAAILAFAGAYQFAPLKRRSLAACRHPGEIGPLGAGRAAGGVGRGIRHGIDCVGSSGALMLVTFAAGFASLWWMGALTVLMLYEATGRHGRRVASGAGIVLVVLASSIALPAVLP